MPRAGLSTDAVVELAVSLVDERSDGLDSLTLAAIAARAGVAVPSLYKHVASLDEVRRRVTLIAVRELTRRVGDAATSAAPSDRFRAVAHAIRRFSHEHPGLAAAAQASGDRQGDALDAEIAAAGRDAIAVVVESLSSYGVPPEHLVDVVRAARATVMGFVVLEASGGFGLPDDVDASFSALLDVFEAGVAAQYSPKSA